MKKTILLLMFILSVGCMHGQNQKTRIGQATYTQDNGDFGTVTIQFDYLFNGSQFKIKIKNVILDYSPKMAVNEPELLNEIKRNKLFSKSKAQSWLNSLNIKYRAEVHFPGHLHPLSLPITGSATGGSTDYTFFEPTSELSKYSRDYYEKHKRNFYDETADLFGGLKITEVYFPELSQAIDNLRRDLRNKKQEQEREKKEQVQKAKAEQEQKVAEEEREAKQATVSPSGNAPAQNNGSTENGSVRSEANATSIDYIEQAKAYNAQKERDRKALESAADQTFDQWAQGNYIQGSQALSYEYARQGNATGAYGAAGAGIALQGAAILGDAFAARKERKAEEAAYNYELNKGIEAYYDRNYTEALRWYKSSYEQGKNTGAAANGIGCAYFWVKNYTEAKKWLDIAISLNYTSRNTNFCLSRMYLDGLGVPKNENYAFELMEKATDDLGFNYPEATYHLAFMYLSGRGATQNYKKSYDLFLSIPSGGPGTPGHNYNKEVDFALGVMYYYGLGLKKNDDMAKKYFEKCSDNYDAQKMLSKITGINNLYNLSKPNNEITHDTFGKFLNL